MGHDRHKHKETLSVLLISNTGQNSKQFHISTLFLKLAVSVVALVCVVAVAVVFWFGTDSRKTAKLQEQLTAQAEQMQKLEEEKESLKSRNIELTQKNEALRKEQQEQHQEETTEEETQSSDPFCPTRHPYDGNGMWIDPYAEGHEYMSIHTKAEGNVIAAGNGTVVLVGSDETHSLVIEIDHQNGYRTRYMCMQEVEVNVQEGAQAENGDVLAKILTDDTQLDYQVIFNDKIIDPLLVIEAKG